MNNKFLDLIKTRKSIRKWTEQKIPENLAQELISCGISAPSAYNAKPWNITIVDKPFLIEKLLSNRMQLKDFPYYINSIKYIDKLGKEKYEKVKAPSLLLVIAGDTKKCSDIPGLISSLSCCAENILLAAHALGLGGCWLYVYDREMPETEKFVKKILNISYQNLILCMLAIGYPSVT